MRSDVAAPLTAAYRKRTTTVVIYPITQTPAMVALDTAIGAVSYAIYTTKIVQTDRGATITMALPSNVTTPVPGQCVSIKELLYATIESTGQVIAFSGVIEMVRGTRVVRGEDRTVTITVRRRDANPYWRNVRRISGRFPAGTELARIARAVSEDIGLGATEYILPDFGVTCAQGMTQLSDVSFWDMLRAALAPGLLEPFVDARGYLKYISRDCRGPTVITLSDNQVHSGPEVVTNEFGVSAVRVKYTDPYMTKVMQQERSFGKYTMTVGFFSPDNNLEVFWSPDRSQRAENVRMEIRESVNKFGIWDAIVADETFTAYNEYGGLIEVDMQGFYSWANLYALIILEVGAAMGASAIPVFGGAASSVALPLAIAHILHVVTQVGTGNYEIVGTPYDYVALVNEVEAYDIDAPTWYENIEDFESTLVPDEDTAYAIACGELIYRNRSAKRCAMTIADDLRIEPGDILLLADTRRFYVTGYSRDLTRGATATLDLEGFLT